MVKRIAALAFIFVCSTIAWLILAGTTQSRTNQFDSRLREKVANLWGAPHSQHAPDAVLTAKVKREVEAEEKGKKVVRTVIDEINTREFAERTRAAADFHLDYRKKGLLWYSTYKVGFRGDYTLRNDTDKPGTLTFTFRFPAANAVYDDLKLTVDGQPVAFSNTNEAIQTALELEPGQAAQIGVSYRSQGMDSWTYRFGDGIAQVRDFQLQMTTDFRNVDFPDNALSPGAKRESGGGWLMTWQYDKLVSGCQIGLAMPQKLQPGPLVGEISTFAPVSLFFFFFVMLVLTTLRGIEVHPVNYFFLACAFFAFHLLMAYLVDHISIHAAFVISSVVSVFLVVSYLRLVVGARFALVEAGLAQLIYLVLFSYAFFFDGYTGLAITIGSILTLFVMMQITGHIRWQEKLPITNPAAKPKNGEGWVESL